MPSKTKEQALLFLQQIEKMIKINIEQLAKLIAVFDKLDEVEKTNIFKTEMRLIQFLQFQNGNISKPKLIQEPFTQEDYDKLMKFEECQTCCSSVEKKLKEMIKMASQFQQENYLQEMEVDRKTNVLTDLGLSKQYYGYLLKKQPNGRGILMNGHIIFNGYFLEGEFMSGQVINLCNCGNIHVQMQQMPGQVLDFNHSNSDYTNKFFNVLQQPLQMMYENDKELFDLLQYNEEEFLKDFKSNYQIQNIPDTKYKEIETMQYLGQSLIHLQTKQLYRHGLGVYFNSENRVFALGVWQQDKLKWGQVVCINGKNKLKAYGQIEESYQQYLK